jgi:integrase
MPYFNEQRGKWMAQVVINGLKYRTQHDTKAEAKQWETAKKNEKAPPSNPVFTLLSWSAAYLAYSAEKHSLKTLAEKKLAFRKLFASVSSETAAVDLHKGLVLAHFATQSRERSGYAANKDRKNLVAAWNWAAEYLPGFPPRNPFLTSRFSEERCARYVPPEKDFWAVYKKAESERDKLMLLCYLHLAARKSEIFYLRREDVDLDRQQIRLCTKKRKDGSLHHDWLPMTNRLRKAMSIHLAASPGLWVFPDPRTGEPYLSRQHWLSRLCRKAKVKPFGLHGIRHLSASILVSSRVSLLDVQTILRHTNLTTTQRYVHRLESVRKAIEVFE